MSRQIFLVTCAALACGCAGTVPPTAPPPEVPGGSHVSGRPVIGSDASPQLGSGARVGTDTMSTDGGPRGD